MALIEPAPLCPDLETDSLEYAPEFGTIGMRTWLRDPHTRHLLDFWNDKRGLNGCPLAADVDPLDIPELVGWTVLVDCPPWGGPGVVRMVGVQIVELAGVDITGRPVSDLPDPVYRRMFEDNFDVVVRTAMPLASRYTRVLGGRRRAFERLDMPLLGAGRVGRQVERVLVAMVATD